MSTTPKTCPLLFAVDDDLFFGDFIVRAARGVGYESYTISSGQALLDRLSEKPDVIVLDISMPGLDGIEVIEALAKAQYSGRLILASGFLPASIDAAASIAKGKGLNLVGAMIKPFRVVQLLELLASPVSGGTVTTG